MRNYLLILFAGLLTTGNLYALSVDKDNKPVEGEPADVMKAPKHQSVSGQRKKPARSLSTFTPTEKISADSAVSFPVDI